MQCPLVQALERYRYSRCFNLDHLATKSDSQLSFAPRFFQSLLPSISNISWLTLNDVQTDIAEMAPLLQRLRKIVHLEIRTEADTRGFKLARDAFPSIRTLAGPPGFISTIITNLDSAKDLKTVDVFCRHRTFTNQDLQTCQTTVDDIAGSCTQLTYFRLVVESQEQPGPPPIIDWEAWRNDQQSQCRLDFAQLARCEKLQRFSIKIFPDACRMDGNVIEDLARAWPNLKRFQFQHAGWGRVNSTPGLHDIVAPLSQHCKKLKILESFLVPSLEDASTAKIEALPCLNQLRLEQPKVYGGPGKIAFCNRVRLISERLAWNGLRREVVVQVPGITLYKEQDYEGPLVPEDDD